MFRFNNRYGEYEGNSIGNSKSLNNLRGVDLSISYRNQYDDLIQRQKTEKEKYAQFLKEQEQYMNIKRQKMLQEKRRQDMLDELRLQRERKLIELRQLREKDKIKDILDSKSTAPIQFLRLSKLNNDLITVLKTKYLVEKIINYNNWQIILLKKA